MSTPEMPWYAIALNRSDSGHVSQFCTFVTDKGSALMLFTSEDLIKLFIAHHPEHPTVHAQVVRTPQQFKELIAGLTGIDPPLRYVAMNPAFGGGKIPLQLQRLEDVTRDVERLQDG